MTHLLASVTGVEEAMIALENGADIIDLKNPQQGALGALPLPVIQQIVAAVDGRRPVSATIGDLPMQVDLIVEKVNQTAATGVDIVKIGLFGSQGHAACIEAMRPLTENGLHIVAVLFADSEPDFNVLPLLAAAGFYGVMLDTETKTGTGLLDCLPMEAFMHFVSEAKGLGLLTGLAGSLRVTDILSLVETGPDYLGFRGDLCEGADRKSILDPERLIAIRQMLQKCNNVLRESPLVYRETLQSDCG